MTNSYNLSKKNKIVFFHGLNNKPQGFDPIIEHFEKLGYETEMIILPCHGKDRMEARDDKEALRIFIRSMKGLEGQEYVAVAFSHGALYLQLWMEKNLPHKPRKQVLLAPALFIRKQNFIVKALSVLPGSLHIMSLQPKVFRRYNTLSAREYNILVQGVLMWQKLKACFRIPTLVIIDPRDELVDASRLKSSIPETQFWSRPYLKKGLGSHHIMFHPDYFTVEEWMNFTNQLDTFLKD